MAAVRGSRVPSSPRTAGAREIADFREIPPGPRAQRVVDLVRAAALWLARHWLALGNGIFLAALVGSAAVPAMMAAGWGWLAEPLFASYRLVCHQDPDRSFFLAGHQMAMCQRDVAIYASLATAGVAFGISGRRWRPLPWRLYLIILLPLAVDGGTQLLGLRESNWELRLLTGALFGWGTVWLAYPHLERFAAQVRLEETERTYR